MSRLRKSGWNRHVVNQPLLPLNTSLGQLASLYVELRKEMAARVYSTVPLCYVGSRLDDSNQHLVGARLSEQNRSELVNSANVSCCKKLFPYLSSTLSSPPHFILVVTITPENRFSLAIRVQLLHGQFAVICL